MNLVDQSELKNDTSSPLWHRAVYEALSSRLTEPSAFPCLFSLKTFSKQLIKFAFVEDASDNSLDSLAEIMRSFAALSRQWDGDMNTAHPLVIAFSSSATRGCETLKSYHEFGWKVLQALHNRDHVAWPDNVSKNPNTPFWSWCFDGIQFFINMSAPAYVRRKSRNLGDYLLFVVNPRGRFDIVAGDNPAGHKIRQAIRDRIDAYDHYAHSPQLGHYQAGELEWYQYDLADENIERRDQCPFHVKSDT